MASFDQGTIRWRNDDGSQTTATWKAAANQAITGAVDVNVRLRLSTNLVGVGSVSVTPKIQYSRNAGTWTDVTAISNVARMSLSANFVDAAATTQQITTGTFGAGQILDINGTATAAVTLDDAGNIVTEHEWCFQVRSADTAAGDQILFRVVESSGSVYGSYSNIAVFNIAGGQMPATFFPFFD